MTVINTYCVMYAFVGVYLAEMYRFDGICYRGKHDFHQLKSSIVQNFRTKLFANIPSALTLANK